MGYLHEIFVKKNVLCGNGRVLKLPDLTVYPPGTMNLASGHLKNHSFFAVLKYLRSSFTVFCYFATGMYS